MTTIELKSTILKLEESEMKGTHKSVILNVTNNGKQLLRKDSSSSSLSSGDVLDRVVVYHEMENMSGVAV